MPRLHTLSALEALRSEHIFDTPGKASPHAALRVRMLLERLATREAPSFHGQIV
jgi:hypothetical protein